MNINKTLISDYEMTLHVTSLFYCSLPTMDCFASVNNIKIGGRF